MSGEVVSPNTERPDHVGPWRILDTLGEGGMGTVYLAEQSQPVKRRVALKLIKLGMDSKAVVARFEQERQALALMQHDGIAKVLDCGTSDRGQPYFVMELVKGIPLVRYCDERRLSLRDRLLLLREVCSAVQHAHQKGVVHRDLKPGNVLVGDEGGRRQVKIIDFGLAKAMGQKLVEATLFTEAGQVVGTPEYMAPEQADPTNQDIDTRADVYSLGVLTYEVLTGQLPFDAQQIRRGGLLEMQRVLKQVEPPRPSAKLSSIGSDLAAVAEKRRTSPAALRKVLRLDLDWVVLKALEKDRNRRYETANALSADLQRHLDHEPLVAGPPSAGYRLKKLLRRHRVQVLTAGLVLLAVLGGGVTTFVQYLRAEDAAHTNAQLARSLDAKVREFDGLAAVVSYERTIANEAELYPPWPSKVAAMERWLADDAGRLLAMRPEIEATVASLRQRALPWRDDDQRRDRESHPRFAEWQTLEGKVRALRRAHGVRQAPRLFLDQPLPPAVAALPTRDLAVFASARWVPDGAEGVPRIWGEEALGLAATQLLVWRADAGDTTVSRGEAMDALAWALFANGLDDAAAEAAERSVDLLAEEGGEPDVASLREAIAGAPQALANAEAACESLQREITARRTWSFAPADEARQFLHDTLVVLLGKLDALAAAQVPAVRDRLAWAKQVAQLSAAHPNAQHTWASVRSAIANNPRYAGQHVALRDDDVVGLVPLGENPVTHLWEFYDLRSAWDGVADPRTLPIPRHAEDGSIAVAAECGIVFVLLPGGTFTMGAQSHDSAEPNYDADARDDEAPHEVTLQPFFFARHELTKGQWKRLSGGEEPGWYEIGATYPGSKVAIGYAHPVEQVDWTMGDTLLRRHGLTLPTEAQWEYGCRAGTRTPWWPGANANDLDGRANVIDPATGPASAESLRTFGSPEGATAGIVAVGSYRANPFGLFDVHGNVWEWCRDWYGPYGGERAGDAYRALPQATLRCNRGGSFNHPPPAARSALRGGNAPGVRGANIGLRAARRLTAE